MIFLSHLLCLYCRDSDDVTLEPNTFNFFSLHSRLADFELHSELLINIVERLADMLENVHDFAVDVNFSICFSEQFFLLRLLRHCSFRPKTYLDEESSIALLNVHGHPFLRALPLSTFPWPVQRQHNLHRELPAHFLELLWQSLLAESSKRVCIAPATRDVALQTESCLCERSLPLRSFVCTSPRRVRFRDKLVARKDFDFPSP